MRPAPPRHAPWRSLLFVLGLTAAMSGLAHARHIVDYNSDLAVVALMAQDILYRGAHPVFFDGSEYAGTLEQHFVALLFSVLPDGPAVHGLAVVLELAAGVALAWAFTRRVFGEKAALAAGLYLALGPSFFYYRGLASAGPYTPLFTLGAGVLLSLAWIERRALADRPVSGGLAALGALVGLAWWTHPLGVTYGAAGAVGLLAGATRRKLTVPGIAGVAVAFLAGSFPWWVRNLQTGWASLMGHEAASLPWRQALARTGELFATGIPVLLGARPTWAPAAAFPGAGVLALLVLSTLVAFGIFLVARGGPLVRHAALVLLSLVVVCTAVALFSPRSQFREPRAFFPLYLAFAPLCGAALTWPPASLPLRGCLGAVVAVLHLAGHLATPSVPPFPRRVIDRLEERGVEAVYASYWTAYPLTLLSRGRIVATPFGTGTVVRRAGDRAFVDAAPAPAFLFDRLEPVRLEDPDRFAAFLRSRGLSYRREEVDGLTLFTDVAPEAVAVARGCFCIPSGLGAEAVVWQGGRGPDRLVQGDVATYRVRASNGAAMSWSLNTNLGYHWLRPDGSVALFDGRRTRLASPLRAGETVEIDIEVEANVEPGEYVLVIDAVEEGVAWFEHLGAPPLRFAVRVEPRAPGANIGTPASPPAAR